MIIFKLDENGDGKVTREEFVNACLKDENLRNLSAPGFIPGFN